MYLHKARVMLSGGGDDGSRRMEARLVGDAMVEMVERLHSIPPHTVAVERFYSRLGFMTQRPRRSRLSVEMLVNMAMVNAWLVATDPLFGKPPRAASRRIAAHASGDGQQGRATTDNGSYNGGDDGEDDEAVPFDEDSPEDTDTDDDAAATAGNGDNESLLHAESTGVAPAAPEKPTSKKRLGPRGVERRFLLAMHVCDLTSPFLLAGACMQAASPRRHLPKKSHRHHLRVTMRPVMRESGN
jgi:hypothetical protein